MPERRKVGENGLQRELAMFPANAKDPFTAAPSHEIAILYTHVYAVANVYGARGDYARAFAWLDLLYRSHMLGLSELEAERAGWQAYDRGRDSPRDDLAARKIGNCIAALGLVRRRPAEERDREVLLPALRWMQQWYDNKFGLFEEHGARPLRFVMNDHVDEIAGITHAALILNDPEVSAFAEARRKALDDWFLGSGKTPDELVKMYVLGWVGLRITDAFANLDLDTCNALQAIQAAKLRVPPKSIGAMFSVGAVAMMLSVARRGGDVGKLRLSSGVPHGFTPEVWWAAGGK